MHFLCITICAHNNAFGVPDGGLQTISSVTLRYDPFKSTVEGAADWHVKYVTGTKLTAGCFQSWKSLKYLLKLESSEYDEFQTIY